MGYRIRVVPEVEVWLGELRETDPGAANLFDAAVDALRKGGADLGPPLVVAVPPPLQDPHPDLEPAYQQQLEKLIGGIYRSVAGAATARKRVGLEIGQLEEQAARQAEQRAQAHQRSDDEGTAFLPAQQSSVADQLADQLADLQRRHAELQAEEERLIAVSQHMQHELEALRQQATPRPAVNPLPLRELRPGAPGWSGLRVLFMVEPPSTGVLLAASTERDWLRAWYTELIPRCQTRYDRDQRGTG